MVPPGRFTLVSCFSWGLGVPQDPFLPCPCPTQQWSSRHLILKIQYNKIRETERRWCGTPKQQFN